MRKLAVIAVLTLALAGCSTGGEEAAETTPPEISEPETIETVEPTPEPEPEPELKVDLPDGYPQVVDIETLPDQVRWAFEDDGTGQAVAVAEGVWAHLTPGATMEDAVNTMSYDGFCASKEAFEREYLDGQTTSGMCW